MSAAATALRAMRAETGTSLYRVAAHVGVSALAAMAAEAGLHALTPAQMGLAADACIESLRAEVSA